MDAIARVKDTRSLALSALVLSVLGVAMLLPSVAGATLPGDNGRIAFVSERDGDFDIYTMNPDGTGVAQITNDPAVDFNPSWSPDGAKIAFASNRGSPADFDVYVMNPDGSGVTPLTDDPANDGVPDWSPTARRSSSRVSAEASPSLKTSTR